MKTSLTTALLAIATLTQAASLQMQISWHKSAWDTNDFKYQVRRYTNGAPTIEMSTWPILATTTNTTTMLYSVDPTLWHGVTGITTNGTLINYDIGPVGIIQTYMPTNLAQVQLHWELGAAPINGYILRWSEGTNASTWLQIGTVNNYQFYTLKPGADYHFTLYSETEEGVWSTPFNELTYTPGTNLDMVTLNFPN